MPPVRVRVPVPVFVSPPVSRITPEKVVLWLLLPMVRVLVPSKNEPTPASEPIVMPGAACVLMSNSPFPESVILAVPPLDLSVKMIAPPSEPSAPPLTVMLAAAAVAT